MFSDHFDFYNYCIVNVMARRYLFHIILAFYLILILLDKENIKIIKKKENAIILIIKNYTCRYGKKGLNT